jgi:hypothetical protein
MTTSVFSVNAQRHPLRGGLRENMLDNSDDLMSIVVLEAGAAWPSWLSEYQRLAPNAVVIAQASAESAELFERRVLHRVAEAVHSGDARVRVGVIVSADSVEQSRMPLRQNVARALLKAMGFGGEAELVLAGDSEELEASRHEIFALAGTLCEELSGAQVNVRVRFSNSKSGVMRSVTPSTPDVEPFVSKA